MPAESRPQRSRNPAEIYEEFFVPALFHDWAERIADVAGLHPGQRVLDVACGTGVLARAALARVQPGGRVVGLDPSTDMLAVAQRKSPEIEWKQGRAEWLPFESDSFDAVVSQFGMMFFEDRPEAVREMMRVLRLGGTLTVAVWDALENSPGYATLTRLLEKLFGATVADSMRTPYNMSDARDLRDAFVEAGVQHVRVETLQGHVRFASIDSMIATERACVFTLGGLLDDAQFEVLQREAHEALHPFVIADGSVEFAAPAHVATATRLE
ncbi:MAG TPA: methyltransferase domain-containing protein [Steroidobacteraceae bacterium]|nr:methyltransferase domain-containing protein [Steroidobacteraceae bacterium]